MSIATTVVASFVPRSLGAIGRDVAHLSTVKATAILGSGLVDHLPFVALKSRILAIPGNVTRLIKIKTERNP
jgi:hypothetical protein